MRIGIRYKGARRARVTALVLAALLVFTMVPVSAADAPSSWAAQELEQARAKGLVIPEADIKEGLARFEKAVAQVVNA